jgi:hypothetical protein
MLAGVGDGRARTGGEKLPEAVELTCHRGYA